MHLCETNVVFRERVSSKISIADPVSDAHKNTESVMAPKSPRVPNKPPTTDPHVKAMKGPFGSNENCYRTQSGRVVWKPPGYFE